MVVQRPGRVPKFAGIGLRVMRSADHVRASLHEGDGFIRGYGISGDDFACDALVASGHSHDEQRAADMPDVAGGATIGGIIVDPLNAILSDAVARQRPYTVGAQIGPDRGHHGPQPQKRCTVQIAPRRAPGTDDLVGHAAIPAVKKVICVLGVRQQVQVLRKQPVVRRDLASSRHDQRLVIRKAALMLQERLIPLQRAGDQPALARGMGGKEFLQKGVRIPGIAAF